MPDTAPPRGWRAVDAAACAVLALITGAYLHWWPRDLYHYDEALLLYEAKRITEGDVPYRDFFEIITPGSLYVFAGAFALFGVNLETARVIMAIVHVGIEWLIYAASLRVGVRSELAFAAALAHLAIGYALIPIASAHWFGTLLMMVSLVLALDSGGRRPPLALGLTTGLLIAFQHQKGVVIGAAAAIVIGLDGLFDPKLAGPRTRRLLADLIRYTVGTALIVVPLFGALLLASGPRPMVDALIRFPLGNYRGYQLHQLPWGFVLWPAIGHLFWVAHVLIRLPYLAGVALLRGLWQWTVRRDWAYARRLLVLAVYLAAAALSILYNADLPHMALIACVGLVAAAETIESGLRAAARAAWLERGTGVAIAAAVVVLIAYQLPRNREWRRAHYAVRAETPFGSVDVGDPNELVLLEGLRQRLAAEPTREVFAYPYYSSAYLLTPADNPTRFQILVPNYNSKEQYDEVVGVLEARRVPYVVVLTYWVDWDDDVIVQYLKRAYERVALPFEGPPPAAYTLFRRKS
jgi:hypothetical protein